MLFLVLLNCGPIEEISSFESPAPREIPVEKVEDMKPKRLVDLGGCFYDTELKFFCKADNDKCLPEKSKDEVFIDKDCTRKVFDGFVAIPFQTQPELTKYVQSNGFYKVQTIFSGELFQKADKCESIGRSSIVQLGEEVKISIFSDL